MIAALALGAFLILAKAARAQGSIDRFDLGGSPVDLVAGPDGNLWFTEPGGAIGKSTPTGQVTEYSAGLGPGSTPLWIASGSDGNLWFTDLPTDGSEGGIPVEGSQRAIGRVTPSGTITEFSDGLNQDGDPIELLAPGEIALGPDGNVWFANGSFWSGGESTGIGRVTPAGTMTLFELPMAGLAGNLVIGPDGNLWFTIWHGPIFQSVGRITPSGTITEFDVTTAGEPRDMVLGPDGNLWIAAKNGIGRLTTTGSLTIFSTGLQSGHSLLDIMAGPGGDLWFSDRGGPGTQSYVGRITTSGTITQFPVEGFNPAGSYPNHLVTGGDGNVWFASMQNVIGRITPSGAITKFRFGLGQSSIVRQLIQGPTGTDIWFLDSGEKALGRVAPVGPGAVSPQPALAVQRAGAGSGSVSSSSGSISCGAACDAFIDAGTMVTLSASPAAGSVFAGWSGGGCSGTGTCQVTMDSDTTVTATFEPSGGGAGGGPGPTDPGPVGTQPSSGAPSGSSGEQKTERKRRAAQKKKQAKRRALKRCQKLKGKAKRKCVKRAGAKKG